MQPKKLLLFPIILLSLFIKAQQTTTVKVPPSKDTTVLKFTTTTNVATNYTTTNIPVSGGNTPPPDTTNIPSDPGIPVGYSLVYSNNFDPGTKLDPNQCGRCSISTSTYKDGGGSFKAWYQAGDPQISGGYRSEQELKGSLSPTGRDLIIEYDELFEQLPTSVQGLSMQWHGTQNGTSGSGSMWISGGKFAFQFQPSGVSGSPNVNQQKQDDGSALIQIKLASWYHLRYEIKWSSGPDGYILAYLNGKLYYSATGKNCDGKGQYPKYGINIFNGNNTVIVYMDNMRMYVR